MLSFDTIKVVGALCGALLALWALTARFERVYRLHLSRTFATKEDFKRLETKVDKVLLGYFQAAKHR